MIKKGQQFLCLENNKDFFQKGDIYEVVYIDNEKPAIQVCLKKDNLTKIIDFDTFRTKFTPYDKRKK